MKIWKLSIFLLIDITSAKVTCLPSTALPSVADCDELVDAVTSLSQLPGEDNLKRWGPELEDNSTAAKVPKRWYIANPPHMSPSTCILRAELFSRTRGPNYDEFKLSDLAARAADIIFRCLIHKEKEGRAWPGPFRTVFVKLEKAPVPPVKALQTKHFHITLGNRTVELWLWNTDSTSNKSFTATK